MAEPSKEWTASALQHHDGPGDAPADDTNKRAGILHMPTVRRLGKQKKGSTSPMDWGMPGELTKEEVDVFNNAEENFATQSTLSQKKREKPTLSAVGSALVNSN
eukprot:2861751-Ditylum_brightwellii.AAC.1